MRAAPWAALAVVAGISLAATLWPEQFGFVQRIPGADKGGHFIVMGLCTLVVVLSLGGTAWRGRRVGAWWLVAAALVVSAVEEIAQRWIPGRNFSWLDLAYSWAGVLVFGTLAALWVRFQRSPAAASEGGS